MGIEIFKYREHTVLTLTLEITLEFYSFNEMLIY